MGITPELNLVTADDTTDVEVYGVTSLADALMIIDALFNAITGHAHDGLHKGKPIAAAGLVQPLALTGPTLTTPTITSPTFTGTVKGQAAWFDPVMLVHI